MELAWTVDRDRDDEGVSEADLVRRAATDADAFAALYTRYANQVFWFLVTLIRAEEEAADLTQLTFLRAYQALPRYRVRGSPFRTWLFRIARNAATDAHRRRRHLVPWDDRHTAVLAADGADPETSAVQREDLRRIQALIAGLPPDQRELVALRFGAGLTCVEIASVLGEKPATVTKRLQRILARFQEECRER